MRFGLVFLIASLLISGRLKAADPLLRFVDLDGEGKLVYERDAKGNCIPDFSHAGYGGGGISLPDAPVRVVVLPAAGDDGARIQAALDYVSHLPPDERGLRGAVLLGASCNGCPLRQFGGMPLGDLPKGDGGGL